VCVSGLIASNACRPAAADDDDDDVEVNVDNPFHEDGELRRKADFIVTHSRISRTQLHIADPDRHNIDTGPVRPHHTHLPLSHTTVPPADQTADAPPLSAASASQQRHSRHDDESTVVTVTSAVTSPLHAETVRINKRKRCVVQ